MGEIDLRRLAERIPLAGDRALAEIVSGLETVDSLNATRRRRRGFKGLIDRIGGADRTRAMGAAESLARNQRHLVSWARDLSEQLAFTDLNVGLLAAGLEQVQHRVAYAEGMARQALSEIRELAGLVAGFMDEVDRRFAEVDRKIAELDRRLDAHASVLETHGELLVAHTRLIEAHEKGLLELDRKVMEADLRQDAWEDMDMAVRRWRHQGAYAGLPWTAQVTLLAREIAAGHVGLHEFVTGRRSWRERLIDDILSDERTRQARAELDWHGRRSVRRLVEHTTGELKDPEERQIVAEVMGIGLPANLRPPHRPLTYALAHGLELGAREPGSAPEEPTAEAVDRARRDYGHLPDSLTQEEFVRRAVDEQADAARRARADLRARELAEKQETGDE